MESVPSNMRRTSPKEVSREKDEVDTTFDLESCMSPELSKSNAGMSQFPTFIEKEVGSFELDTIITKSTSMNDGPKLGKVVESFERDTIKTNSASMNDEPKPGMWQFSTDPNVCCIYRVPNIMRQVNPEAYTPQLVLIGPLQHSLKFQAFNSRGDKTNTRLMDYFNIEEHKTNYLAEFAKRLDGEASIEEFRRMIEEDEYMIRASYSESTAWIPSPEFVHMILRDSVFIMEFILRICEKRGSDRKGDRLIDEPCNEITIKRDLIMLENQIPYFILEKLFDPVVARLSPDRTLLELIIDYFEFSDIQFMYDVQDMQKFMHFTDLVRCVRVETIMNHRYHRFEEFKPIGHMYNAYKLHNGGMNFKSIENELSIKVEYKKGCLKIPRLVANVETEITLRNIMGLEQCHYPSKAHVSNYILFLDLLIDTEKDVDVLVERGIIRNMLGHNSMVAQMVNNLGSGVSVNGSYYSDIVDKVQTQYSDPIFRSVAVIKRAYVAATFLLIMTLIQAVASIIQVAQNM